MVATATAAPKRTTGEQAINAAMVVGFEITEHGRVGGLYRHQFAHSDGRALIIDTELDSGRLFLAVGRNRSYWNATYLAARNLKTLRVLLAAGSKTPDQMPQQAERRCNELTDMHLAALDNERRMRNDLRRERRQLYGR